MSERCGASADRVHRHRSAASCCALGLGVVEAFHFEAPRKFEPVSWKRFHGVWLALCSMVENWMVVGTRQCCHVATHAWGICGHGRFGGSRSPARQCVAPTLVLALASCFAYSFVWEPLGSDRTKRRPRLPARRGFGRMCGRVRAPPSPSRSVCGATSVPTSFFGVLRRPRRGFVGVAWHGRNCVSCERWVR